MEEFEKLGRILAVDEFIFKTGFQRNMVGSFKKLFLEGEFFFPAKGGYFVLNRFLSGIAVAFHCYSDSNYL